MIERPAPVRDVRPRVGIGLAALAEVYGPNGLLIRAYTHDHIETVARAGGEVRGEEPTPRREGVDGGGWASQRSGMPTSIGPRC